MKQEDLKRVLEQHGLWLASNLEEGERANLEGANLKGAYLEGSNLEGVNLKGAYLKGAYLEGSNLEGANLEGANLKGANLEGANLEGANLKGAYLKGAFLKGANLKGANLTNVEGIYIFNKAGGRTCYAVIHGKGLMIQAGCFWGTLAEFEAKAIAEQKGYAAQIAYLKAIEASL